MSKRPSKHRLPSRGPRPHARAHPSSAAAQTLKSRRIDNRLVLIIIAIILAAIPFCLGKYFEFNSPGAYDSGAYVYSAAHILDGAKIGVEEKPSAQLGTLLVNMLGVRFFGFSDTGPKIVQMLLQAAALAMLFLAMRRLFGAAAAGVGLIVASVYLSAPLIAKFGNVKEQYMIAFMVMGISCFVFYQLAGRWWQAILAGAFLVWAGLFKQTGVSAMGAVGVFVLLQPVFRHKTLRETGRDIGLLLAGAAAGLAPLYIWMLAWRVQMSLPYSFVWETLAKMLGGGASDAEALGGYVSGSRKLVPFSEQWPRVLRYYGLLILPIALAGGAVIARLARMISAKISTEKGEVKTYERFVLLLGVWWLLDMAFVWISPRSYEQYYLPLNASAAMLGGYLIALYAEKAKAAGSKPKWIAVGFFGLVLMVVLSWHIFFGIKTSPHTGHPYPARSKGYSQKFGEVHRRRKENLKAPWESTGEYIRGQTTRSDKIYVWGWVPGIYVKAERFSSASKAFCMPRPAPAVLGDMVDTLLKEFGKEMPKFIVDTRKRHIPTERPPYLLWQVIPKGYAGASKNWFMPLNKQVMADYDTNWANEILRKRFGEDEALRYEAMAPFREFVMQNYEIAAPEDYFAIRDSRLLYHRIFGEHVVFRLKSSAAGKERQ